MAFLVNKSNLKFLKSARMGRTFFLCLRHGDVILLFINIGNLNSNYFLQ